MLASRAIWVQYGYLRNVFFFKFRHKTSYFLSFIQHRPLFQIAMSIFDITTLFHRELINGKIKFWCRICKKHISNRYLHAQMHEGKRFACDKCPATYTRKAALRKHRETKHENYVYECICGQIFDSYAKIHYHQQKIIHIFD